MSAGQPVFAAKAKNSEIWDVEGRRFIDFGGGIAVLNTGHRHPKVMKRVYEQLERYTHTCLMVTPYEPAVQLAEKLNAIAPITGPNKTMLVTTGAEAVENAIKIARAATGRTDVIVFTGAFHGRTLLTMAMTGKVVPYKTKFGPFPPGIWRVPYPVEHKGFSVDDTSWRCNGCSRPMSTRRTSRRSSSSRCRARAVSTSRRRTSWCACASSATSTASSSSPTRSSRASGAPANGSPWSITASSRTSSPPPRAWPAASRWRPWSARRRSWTRPEPGGLGGTYAGNPVACAAGARRIEAFETEDLLAKSLKQGETILKRLKAIKKRRTGRPIGDIRGLGGMTAFELVTAAWRQRARCRGGQGALGRMPGARADDPHLRRLWRDGAAAGAADDPAARAEGRARHPGGGAGGVSAGRGRGASPTRGRADTHVPARVSGTDHLPSSPQGGGGSHCVVPNRTR